MSNLENLPKDMLWEIGFQVDKKDFARFCRLSRKFNNIVCNDDNFWKENVKRKYGKVPQLKKSWKKTYALLSLPEINIGSMIFDQDMFEHFTTSDWTLSQRKEYLYICDNTSTFVEKCAEIVAVDPLKKFVLLNINGYMYLLALKGGPFKELDRLVNEAYFDIFYGHFTNYDERWE